MVKCVYKYEKNDKVKQLKQILQKYDYCKSFWIFWNVFSYFLTWKLLEVMTINTFF